MVELTGMNDRGRFSLLGAWALAFGCALGWDALSIPWTTLLPAAGPLGTAIGVLLKPVTADKLASIIRAHA